MSLRDRLEDNKNDAATLPVVAVQNGVTGTVPVGDPAAAPAEPVEPPLPPHHQEAFDAIAAGEGSKVWTRRGDVNVSPESFFS